MKNKQFFLGLGFLFLIFSLIFGISCTALADDDDDTIYVSAGSSSGDTVPTASGDGSDDDPYNTLQDALDRADEGDTVEIRSGTYRGNFVIPDGISLEGVDKDRVSIVATDDQEPVFKMEDQTKIKNVTIKGGKYGIYVKPDSEAMIDRCIIQENKSHGIKVRRTPAVDDWLVTIQDSFIQNNGGSGVYAQKRMLIIEGNEILNNERDGMYLQGEVLAYVNDNKVKYNNRTGMDVMLDSSELLIENNSFDENDNSAIEVHAFVGYGSVEIMDCKFDHNGSYAVERVQHSAYNEAVFYGLVIGAGNTYDRDKKLSDIKVKIRD